MSSPETIDLSRLLEPFGGENPAGVDLRNDDADDSLFRQIKSLRRDSSMIERKHVENPEDPDNSLSRCAWDKVQQLCVEALSNHSKDFEVAAWLCESLVRNSGVAGLRNAFRLTRELAEKYWEHLYPLPDDGDITPRVRLLSGLFQGALLLPIKRIPITADEDVTFLDWDDAMHFASITDSKERDRYLSTGKMSCAQIEQVVLQTDDDFYRNLMADLHECITELDKLDDVLSEKCSTDASGKEMAPATGETMRLLDECSSTLTRLLGDRIRLPDATEESDGQEEMQGDSHALSQVGPTVPRDAGQQMTRDTALRLLLELATFFRQTEPHSPVSHHIEQAVRWGKMSLPDLLKELITDDDSRKAVFTRVGIEERDDPDA